MNPVAFFDVLRAQKKTPRIIVRHETTSELLTARDW